MNSTSTLARPVSTYSGQWMDGNGYSESSWGGEQWRKSSIAIACQWEALRKQILLQWGRLTTHELDEIGPDRRGLASLIQSKYGIAAPLVENYLRNFERTLPLM